MDFQSLNKDLLRQGWSIEKTGGNHLRYIAPQGNIVIRSSTCSDKNGLHNFLGDLKRAGYTKPTRHKKKNILDILVLFDIDVLIPNTAPAVIHAITNAVSSLSGNQNTVLTTKECKVYVNNDLMHYKTQQYWVLQELQACGLNQYEAIDLLPDVKTDIIKRYKQYLKKETLNPGVEKLFDFLIAKETTIGIVSPYYKEVTKILLEVYNLWSCIDRGAFGDNKNEKIKTLNSIQNLDDSKTIYVLNNKDDIVIAKHHYFIPFAIGKSTDYNIDNVFSSLEELIAVI